MLLRKEIALLLSVLMVVGMMPALSGTVEVHADSTIATINGKPYTSFIEMSKAMRDLSGADYTIDMTRDWNAAGEDQFDNNLVIYSGSTVTLNMHGHIFNRDKARNDDYSRYGELINMDNHTSLIINGSGSEQESKTEHKNVPVCSTTQRDEHAAKTKTFYGGVLSGGNSICHAGGIHVGNNCTLTLNRVTIAGCDANDTSVTPGGSGGGIKLDGANVDLRLKDSTITGCHAYDNGAGIFVNKDKCSIELINSVIEDNYAYFNGGGIATDSGSNGISGGSGSRISSNHCGSKGAGLYLGGGDGISASNLEITGNKGIYGAGVYTNNEEASISGLTITKNLSTKQGGGVFVNDDETTISSCDIRNNTATTDGGGVYSAADNDVGFNVTGKTIVIDNKAKGMGNDFFISDSDAEDTRVNFSLTKGSDVSVSYAGISSKSDAVMVTEGKVGDTKKSPNCIQFLRPGNPEFHFTYNAAPNQRKIYYVRNGKDDASKYGDPVPERPPFVKINAELANGASKRGSASDQRTDAGIVGLVGPGGYERKSTENDYYLIYGFAGHEETDSDTNDTASGFYYSDGFFDAGVDPAKYNEHLAAASITMAYSGMYLRKFEKADANGNTYYNKHAAARQFMADIGCPDQNIYVNDSNVSKPGTDSIGVTIASKTLSDYHGELDTILVPIVVRGGGYEKEWSSNATLDKAGQVPGKEASGFANAATQVTEEIEKYISKYGLEDKLKAGKVNFWISGFSRAGATANLTAKRLVEKYASGDGEGKNNKVFAYTCEAPMGGTDDAEKLDDKTKYYSIHNMINAADVVPLVAPELMGFKRYGVDHYIPGTEAGAVKENKKSVSRGGKNGATTVTTYSDNEVKYIKDKNRDGLKKVTSEEKAGLLKQLKAIDSGIIVDDYFHPMAMKFLMSPEMYEDGKYDGNNSEDFILDFIRFVQEGKAPGDSDSDWSQSVKNRDHFAESIQPALRDTLGLVFSMSAEDSAGFIGRASSITNKISTIGGDISMLDLYDDVIGDWHTLSQSKKNKYITKLWKKLEQTGAFEFLSYRDKAQLETNWPLLAEFIFTLVSADYEYSPGKDTGRQSAQNWAAGASDSMMYIPTFATYASYILLNHYPELNMAWARYYDSYYANDTKEFQVVTDGWSVGKPTAYSNEMKAENKLVEGEKKENKFTKGITVILENEDIAGEAIYYDLKDNETGDMLAQNEIYRGGIDLALKDDLSRSFTVTCYAMSYGIRSEVATYNVKLISSKHRVVFDMLDSDGNEQKAEYWYDELAYAHTEAGIPSDKYFGEWSVSMLGKDGKVRPEYDSDYLTGIVLGSKKKYDRSQTFMMPPTGTAFPEGYGLLLKANYNDRINTIEMIHSEAPYAGSTLPEGFDVAFKGGDGSTIVERYPVEWTYKQVIGGEERVCAAPERAFSDTEYTATLIIDPDEDKKILFAPEVSISEYASDVDGTLIRRQDKAVRDEADGSIRVSMTFKATDSAGGDPKPAADEHIKFSVRAWDTYAQDFDPDTETAEYYAVPNEKVSIACPVVPGEKFVEWDAAESRVIPVGLSDEKLFKVELREGADHSEPVKAVFTPVIGKVEVNFYDADGNALQPKDQSVDSVKVEALITVSNTYEIDPADISVTWSPEIGKSGKFTPGVKYSARASIKTDEDGTFGMRIKGSDGEYARRKLSFDPSESIKVVSNEISDMTVSLDPKEAALTRIFSASPIGFGGISLSGIRDVKDIPHGASEDDVIDTLQDSVLIDLDDGTKREVNIEWDNAEPDKSEDSLQTISWEVKGKLDIPDDIHHDSNDVTSHVTVNEADYTAAPVASLESGTYLSDQVITLEAGEGGGNIFYTTDGSDPQENGKAYTEGDQILFRRNDITADKYGVKSLVLRAYAKKDGQFNSAESAYEYVFGNEIPAHDEDDAFYCGFPQVIVPASRYYKIEPVSAGITIDDDGNALAEDAGTYILKLSLTDKDMEWTLDGEKTTTEDQTVKFTIKPLPISVAAVSGLKNKAYTGKAVKQSLKLMLPKLDTKLKAGKDYSITYSKNVKPGIASAKITGSGNYEGETTVSYNITVNGKLRSAKAARGRKAVIRWKKAKLVSGYQIRYSTNKKFKKGIKKVTIKSPKTVKKTIRKLKAGKKYYVQIRTFNKVKDASKKTVKIYGRWSKSKTFKAKR